MSTANRVRLCCSLVLILCASSFAEKIREDQWQQGTLVKIATDVQTRAGGYVNNGTGFYGTSVYVVTHYLIDTPDYRYEVNRLLRRKDKQLLVTVNGPIQYFFDGKHFYIRDDLKEQHEVIFVQRIKKPLPATP
jgi:hypothetical protein